MPFGYCRQNILGLLYTLGLQTHVPSAIHSAWYSEYQQRVVELMNLVIFFYMQLFVCGGDAHVLQCVRGVCLITRELVLSLYRMGLGNKQSC